MSIQGQARAIDNVVAVGALRRREAAIGPHLHRGSPMKFLLVALSFMAAVPALAANADAPNQNVDKRNDAGGSTGNDQVDRLNKGQLDQNQHPAPASQDPPPAK